MRSGAVGMRCLDANCQFGDEVVILEPAPSMIMYAPTGPNYSLASRNSETVRPEARMRLRSVPRATSLWSGTESVAILPGLMRMM